MLWNGNCNIKTTVIVIASGAKSLLGIFPLHSVLCIEKREEILSNLAWVTVWGSATISLFSAQRMCQSVWGQAPLSQSQPRHYKARNTNRHMTSSAQEAQCSSTLQHLQANKQISYYSKVSTEYTFSGSALLSFFYICILCVYSYFSLSWFIHFAYGNMNELELHLNMFIFPFCT